MIDIEKHEKGECSSILSGAAGEDIDYLNFLRRKTEYIKK